MKISTELFGEIEVNEEELVLFPEGLLAFESYREFALLNLPQSSAFKWLQSVEGPSVGFLLTNPFQFYPDYEFDLSEKEKELLEIKNADDVATLTIVSMNGSKLSEMTTNLAGPILINIKAKRAKQIVLPDHRYTTRERLMKQSEKGTEATSKEACK